jgi:ABC-type proline/glycine betaine transport system permease subunit
MPSFSASSFRSGLLDSLSIMKEFATRADQFWSEALSHLLLAFGSLAIAIIIGLPLGITLFLGAEAAGGAAAGA